MNNKDQIVLIGGGGHCHSVIDVIEQENRYKIMGIVDIKENISNDILGYKVIGCDDDLETIFQTCKNACITVGHIKSNELRVKLFALAKKIGFKLPVIISPLAYVSKHAKVDDGTVIMHHALINANAKIGKNCIINTKALIEHDAVVEDHCHISTASVLNGGVIVKENTFFGSNSMARESIEIGSNVTIGGGCERDEERTQQHSCKEIYMIGASGFASEVTEYILNNGDYIIKGYFDINDNEYKKYKYEAPFLGNEKEFNFTSNDNVVIAIADYKLRNKIYLELKNKGVNFPNILHKSTFVSKSSQIDEGSVLCPFVTLTSNVKIGKNFQANIYSYVAHDCIIGDNVTFAPSVKCNGNVVIEDDVYIGTGVIIHQGKANKPLRIGKGAVIAAGAVVTKSVAEGKVMFGNPAVEFTKENIKRRS